MGRLLLLDTHALIWAAVEPNRLGATARRAMENGDNNVLVSPVSAMEIATKVRLGKLDLARPFATDFLKEVAALGFEHLPIDARHAQHAGNLPFSHKDPFDRLLIAQAQLENLRLVSNEKRFDDFAVLRLW